MKKRVIISLLTVLLMLSMVTACGVAEQGTAEKASQPSTITEDVSKEKVCYITVEDHCSEQAVEVTENMTVYDALKATDAKVSAKSTGYGVYVEGINGRFEFDEGSNSGWVYTVNGNRVSESCDGYKVSGGDQIVWSYVK